MIATIYEKVKGLRVTTDTRKIEENDLFIALKGDHFDGNKFAKLAIESGARYAVIDNPEMAIDDRYIVVEDGLTFLQQLAAHHRRVLKTTIIAITGTNGKTTTKELCHCLLSKKYNTIATYGNLNNHIGVPLTLLSINANTEIAIIEMGANHPKEIGELCRIADPDFGIITNIGRAHLEGFGSYENIIETKCELYDYICNKNGTLFVNLDDPLLLERAKDCHKITYGNRPAQWAGSLLQGAPMVVALHTPKGDLYAKTALIGGYNFSNAMAAVAVSGQFGVDPLQQKEALETYSPSNMRSQLKKSDTNILIIDAYNANPSSMQVALTNFEQMPSDYKIAILGEMRELGNNSLEEHQRLVDRASQMGCKHIYWIGDSFLDCKIEDQAMTCFHSVEELQKHIQLHPIHNAMILIKGSRGNQLEKIIDFL